MIDPEKITTLPFEEIWNHFKVMKNQFSKGDVNKAYKNVRFGNGTTRFDIELYFNKIFQEKPKVEAIFINKNWFNYSDFFSEIEQRHRILAEFLLLNYEEDSIVH